MAQLCKVTGYVKLHHGLEWYTSMYTTRDYGITYLCHDHRVRPTRAYVQCDKLVTLQWSGLWDVISLKTLC